jgi:hypothetical protein
MAWVLTAGAGVADAATHYRSGRVRANLLESSSRVAPNGSSSGLHGLTGPDVMAAFVGLMAVLAFMFLVVTLIRRRVPAPTLAPGRAA